MCWSEIRELMGALSEVATVATAIVAVWFFCISQYRAFDRKKRLEQYLEQARTLDGVQGRKGYRTPMRIAANLSMTMTDVWNAATNSSKIKTQPIFRGGFAVGIMFYYDDGRSDRTPSNSQ
jgi:hypothetical protein